MKSLFKLQTSLVLSLSFIAAASSLEAAVPFQLTNTITHPTPSEHLRFGSSINTFNSNLIVGTSGQSKTAYVIDPTNGAVLTTMTSPDLNPDPTIGAASFGDSLLQVGQNIVITDHQYSPTFGNRQGSAYIFDGTTGQNLFTIRDPNPQPAGYFGVTAETVAGKLFISGGSVSDSDPGTVYVFNPTNASFTNTILNPEPGAGHSGFGIAMQPYNGNLFISATRAPVGATTPGAVYLYDGTTLAPMMKISSPNPLTEDRFGESLAVANSKLLVGANVDFGGIAYLFDANTGSLLQTFNNPEPGQFLPAGFGSTVALVGDYAVVGTQFANDGQNGAAYVFDTISGSYLGKIPPPSSAFRFPSDLLTVGNTLYASNYFLPVNNFDDAGGVFVYTVIPEPSQIAVMIFGAAVCIGAISRKKRAASSGRYRM